MFTINSLLKTGLLATWVIFLLGCASEPPREALLNAETAIQNADRAGASQYESALLSSARTKLRRANHEVDIEENDEARRLAEEAIAEASLASARTDAEKQAKATNAMKKAIDALKHEASRTYED